MAFTDGAPLMSIKQMPLPQSTFTPTLYKGQTPDISILQKSMAQREARTVSAYEKLGAVDTALGAYLNKLNNSELEWFNGYKQDIKNKIQTQIDSGNYGDAIKIAISMAGKVNDDVRLAGRVKANETYNTALNKIKSSNLDDLTKERWAATNKYYYEDKYDSNGNVVSGTDWKESWTPVEDVKIDYLQRLAENMTATHSGGVSSSKSYQEFNDANGNPTKSTDDARAIRSNISKSGSTSYSRKNRKDMEDSFYNIIKDANIRLSLNQKFENELWAYDEYSKKANDSTLSQEDRDKYSRKLAVIKDSITDSNGIIYTPDKFETWMKNTILPQFKNMEFDNVNKSDGSSINITEDTLGYRRAKDISNQNANDATIPEDVYTEGTPVKRTSTGGIDFKASYFSGLYNN